MVQQIVLAHQGGIQDERLRAFLRDIGLPDRVPGWLEVDQDLADGDLHIGGESWQRVAEKFWEKKLWPEDRSARAHARSICAEMHSGFTAMRNRMPMNCEVMAGRAVAEWLRLR